MLIKIPTAQNAEHHLLIERVDGVFRFVQTLEEKRVDQTRRDERTLLHGDTWCLTHRANSPTDSHARSNTSSSLSSGSSLQRTVSSPLWSPRPATLCSIDWPACATAIASTSTSLW